MTKVYPPAVWLALLLTISFRLWGQNTPDIDLQALDRYYAKMVSDWEIPGVSIGIVKDGKLIFTGNYGVLEAGKPARPDEHTLYAIASNSKAFTSALIGMLVQEGKLSWDDKVQQYLPYFALYDPWVSREVTVRDLLSHRVGLGTFSGDVIWYKSDLTSEEIIRRAKHLPKAYDFRAGYGYSNIMYITAGQLIEKITGKSWGDNVKERIFKPLGMNRTITSIQDLDTKGNFATPHARVDGQNVPIDWQDWEEIGATGGIISSVDDLAQWMIFNLNHGVQGSDTLLTKETRNTIWTPHNNFTVDHTAPNNFHKHFSAYGLGWGLSDYHGRMMVGHTGGYDGMITAIALIPDENLGVVVLTNGMKSPIQAAYYYALDRFLGQKEVDWSSKLLAEVNQAQQEDTRITGLKEKRVLDTQPSVARQSYPGVYRSDIYGEIRITRREDTLRMEFEHSPGYAATLSHWHYDVWQIHWDEPQAWFTFGTVRFVTNSNMEVTGLEFNVPNDDIFFEELKPYKISSKADSE